MYVTLSASSALFTSYAFFAWTFIRGQKVRKNDDFRSKIDRPLEKNKKKISKRAGKNFDGKNIYALAANRIGLYRCCYVTSFKMTQKKVAK